MEEIYITVETKALIDILKLLKQSLKSQRDKNTALCSIIVHLQEIEFIMPGCLYRLQCKTRGAGSFRVPMLHFFEIVKTCKKDTLTLKVDNRFIDIDGAGIMVKDFKRDMSLFRPKRKDAELPSNYDTIDLLRLDRTVSSHNSFSPEIVEKIYNARTKYKRDITRAHNILKTYGVKKEAIQKLMDEGI